MRQVYMPSGTLVMLRISSPGIRFSGSWRVPIRSHLSTPTALPVDHQDPAEDDEHQHPDGEVEPGQIKSGVRVVANDEPVPKERPDRGAARNRQTPTTN